MPNHWGRALLLGSLPAFFLAGPALAHAILLDSLPPPEGELHAGRFEIQLRFNSRIDAARSRVALSRDGQSEAVAPQSTSDRPDTLLCPVDLVPGKYTLHWQVLAVDGHITRGIVPFVVTPASGN